MKFPRKEDLILSLILTGFALLILQLIVTGKITLYVNAKLVWLLKLTAFLLIGMALAKLVPEGLLHNHKHSHACQCHGHGCSAGHHDHNHSISSAHLLIFLLPLLFGFAIQPRVLGAAALANSINAAGPVPFYAVHASNNYSVFTAAGKTAANPGQTAENPVKTSQNGPSLIKDTDLVDLAFKIYDHPDQAYDKPWRLTCFVYKDPALAKNQFVMTRVVLTCCIADAAPIGIIAETPDANAFKEDTWLEVEGVLQRRSVSGAEKIHPVNNLQATDDGTPYFVVTSWKRVPVPKDPYLVPPML